MASRTLFAYRKTNVTFWTISS